MGKVDCERNSNLKFRKRLVYYNFRTIVYARLSHKQISNHKDYKKPRGKFKIFHELQHMYS